MKRIIVGMLIGLGFALGSFAQTPPASEYRQEGIASWYGSEFDGRSTASGEAFDSTRFTAAHQSLPFGTMLMITNLQNNKQVIVTVNDRGPFNPARLIDVSEAAAKQLEMIATGTAPVLIERVMVSGAQPSGASALPSTPPAQSSPLGQTQPAPNQAQILPPPTVGRDPSRQDTAVPTQATVPLESARTPPYAVSPVRPSPAEIRPGIPPAGTDKRYRIQVGAYKVLRNAIDVFDKLKSTGLNPAYERNGEIYRVVLSGIKADEVQAVAEKLGGAGFREALIREE
ncbi:MAG: septal ring lytic transglycosylase RlpA family protein [Spirochaetaceae bacterium]|jgi:rare lipoprotein A|nr:septal ring lytic transglycosylase RlpA family protein [Spirochaetaceae bacterium]